jgi:hypothetical protein
MLSPKHDDDVHCVFVCIRNNHIDPKVCIAAFTSIRDAALFADILGVRYVIEPYPRDSVMVRDIKIVESLFYGN